MLLTSPTAIASPENLTGKTEIVAAIRDKDATGIVPIDSPSAEALLKDGSVVFSTVHGVFWTNGDRAKIHALLLFGEPAPKIDGLIVEDYGVSYQSNAQNQILLLVNLKVASSNETAAQAIYTYRSGDTDVRLIAQTGTQNPNGTAFKRFQTDSLFLNPSRRSTDGFVIGAKLSTQDNTDSEYQAIYLIQNGTMVEVVRDNAPSPGNLGTLSLFGADCSLSGSNVVAFVATERFENPDTGFLESRDGVFLWKQTEGISRAAMEGDLLPDGTAKLGRPLLTTLGASGVVFQATLIPSTMGQPMGSAILRVNEGVLHIIARENSETPRGGGSFGSLLFPMISDVNDSGEVAFWSDIRGAADGAKGGLFAGDGIRTVTLVRSGDPVPGGGRFGSFRDGSINYGIPDINNHGQVSFLTSFSPTTNRFDNPQQVLVMASTSNTELMVLAVVDEKEVYYAQPSRHGFLNDSGQVAFSAYFKTPWNVVARWTPSADEPVMDRVRLVLQADVPNRRAVIRWPTNSVNVGLEGTVAFGSAAQWTLLELPKVIQGTHYEVTVPMNGTHRFFRLR